VQINQKLYLTCNILFSRLWKQRHNNCVSDADIVSTVWSEGPDLNQPCLYRYCATFDGEIGQDWSHYEGTNHLSKHVVHVYISMIVHLLLQCLYINFVMLKLVKIFLFKITWQFHVLKYTKGNNSYSDSNSDVQSFLFLSSEYFLIDLCLSLKFHVKISLRLWKCNSAT